MPSSNIDAVKKIVQAALYITLDGKFDYSVVSVSTVFLCSQTYIHTPSFHSHT